MSRPRHVAVLLHRYVGLTLAGFLIIVGLTGACIAWNDELERLFAPALFVLPPHEKRQTPLDPFALREAAERAVPGFAVNSVDFTRRPDQPAFFAVEAQPGGSAPHDDEIALDPVSGQLLGARRHGDLRQGTVNFMPFLYELHESLALGATGTTVLGLVALLWTVDSLVGAYLTLPVRALRRRNLKAWAERWRPAWKIRTLAAPFKLLFDLHRAGGLWLWGLLFTIAWSSVAFNLPQVYAPVMAALFGKPPIAAQPSPRDPLTRPRLDWRAAHRKGVRAMAEAAAREGFTVWSERLMFYDPSSHVYSYRVRSDRDPGRLGNTQLTIDGDTGRALHLDLPTGRDAGTTVTTWIEDIHEADVFGRPMQALLTLTGMGVVMLSVTGVWIWWRKRHARSQHEAGKQAI